MTSENVGTMNKFHYVGVMYCRFILFEMIVDLAYTLMNRLSHKLLGNFSATFEIFGNFLEFWQLLEFSATLGFLRFFEATFFTF